jgi:hypothetical protein
MAERLQPFVCGGTAAMTAATTVSHSLPMLTCAALAVVAVVAVVAAVHCMPSCLLVCFRCSKLFMWEGACFEVF